MSRLCEEDRNTEARRTQSFPSRRSSVISVPLCFKTSPSEPGYGLTCRRGLGAKDDRAPLAAKLDGSNCELATQFHESEILQAVIRDNMQKLGFAKKIETQRHGGHRVFLHAVPL